MTNDDILRHWRDFQQGNQRSFGFVIEYYQKRIFYFLLGKLGDRENAAEMVSKLWMRLIQNKSKEIVNLDGYVFQIAKNLLKDEYKLRDRRPDFESTDGLEVKLDSTTVYMYDHQELQEKVKKIITKQEYEICQLMEEGYNYKDIANKVGLSSSTVANKLTDIRQKLKPLLITTRKR